MHNKEEISLRRSELFCAKIQIQTRYGQKSVVVGVYCLSRQQNLRVLQKISPCR